MEFHQWCFRLSRTLWCICFLNTVRVTVDDRTELILSIILACSLLNFFCDSYSYVHDDLGLFRKFNSFLQNCDHESRIISLLLFDVFCQLSIHAKYHYSKIMKIWRYNWRNVHILYVCGHNFWGKPKLLLVSIFLCIL